MVSINLDRFCRVLECEAATADSEIVNLFVVLFLHVNTCQEVWL